MTLSLIGSTPPTPFGKLIETIQTQAVFENKKIKLLKTILKVQEYSEGLKEVLSQAKKFFLLFILWP